MKKKIIYIGDKDEQTVMRVGRFKKGIPKEVSDEVAKDLVDGKRYVYFIETEPPIVINSPRYIPAEGMITVVPEAGPAINIIETMKDDFSKNGNFSVKKVESTQEAKKRRKKRK